MDIDRGEGVNKIYVLLVQGHTHTHTHTLTWSVIDRY